MSITHGTKNTEARNQGTKNDSITVDVDEGDPLIRRPIERVKQGNGGCWFMTLFIILFIFGTTMMYIRPNKKVFIVGIVLDTVACLQLLLGGIYLLYRGCV